MSEIIFLYNKLQKKNKLNVNKEIHLKLKSNTNTYIRRRTQF